MGCALPVWGEGRQGVWAPECRIPKATRSIQAPHERSEVGLKERLITSNAMILETLDRGPFKRRMAIFGSETSTSGLVLRYAMPCHASLWDRCCH